jgi:hypothetical protein
MRRNVLKVPSLPSVKIAERNAGANFGRPKKRTSAWRGSRDTSGCPETRLPATGEGAGSIEALSRDLRSRLNRTRLSPGPQSLFALGGGTVLWTFPGFKTGARAGVAGLQTGTMTLAINVTQ